MQRVNVAHRSISWRHQALRLMLCCLFTRLQPGTASFANCQAVPACQYKVYVIVMLAHLNSHRLRSAAESPGHFILVTRISWVSASHFPNVLTKFLP
jgi:hypothetical protein